MDPEHVALAWCVRFAGQIISRTVKGADGLTAFQRAFQRASHPRAMPAAWGEKILYLEASKKKVQITDKFLDGVFLGIKEGSEEFIVGNTVLVVWYAELSKDGLGKTQQIQSFETASVEHSGDCCQMTNRENTQNQENNRCELMCVLCILTFLFQSTRNQPGHVECTSEIQSSWQDMGTLRGCIGCEAATTQGPSRDHTEQWRTRIIQAMSSDADLLRTKECHVQYLMRNQHEKVEVSLNTRLHLFHPRISTPHTVSAPVAHGGSSSSSASLQITPTVEHVQPDDSDEHIGSKKLKLSEPGSLPSSAPMSADVNLSSDDMRVECLLDRFERERVANKSNDPLLSRIAGWVPDEQFLEVAGLDGPARCRVAYDLLKLGRVRTMFTLRRLSVSPRQQPRQVAWA